jgi:cobalt-zinc-cadmium efflux system protein
MSSMTREQRLRAVLALNAVLVALLLVVGLRAHSLGVLAAGGDYATDIVAIALSLLAARVATRQATAKRSYGYERTTVLVALFNTALVLGTTVVIAYVGLRRLLHGVGHVRPGPVVAVSLLAGVVMSAGAWLLREDRTVGVRAIFLETASDALAALGVALSGAVILITHRCQWLDPVVGLGIAALMGWHAVGLLREISDVLMESTPVDVDLDALVATLRASGAREVHDLHVWGLAETRVLSAHVVVEGSPTLCEAQARAALMKVALRDGHGIAHATLELESGACAPGGHHERCEGCTN